MKWLTAFCRTVKVLDPDIPMCNYFLYLNSAIDLLRLWRKRTDRYGTRAPRGEQGHDAAVKITPDLLYLHPKTML